MAGPAGIRRLFEYSAERTIIESCREARRFESTRRHANLHLEPGEQKPHAPTQKSRSLLVFRKNLPDLPLDDIDGRRIPFDPMGKVTLVNLWASWCQPCLVELADFADHYDSLRAEGIEIVAVSVDGVGQDPGSRDAARATAKRLAGPFPYGWPATWPSST